MLALSLMSLASTAALQMRPQLRTRLPLRAQGSRSVPLAMAQNDEPEIADRLIGSAVYLLPLLDGARSERSFTRSAHARPQVHCRLDPVPLWCRLSLWCIHLPERSTGGRSRVHLLTVCQRFPKCKAVTTASLSLGPITPSSTHAGAAGSRFDVCGRLAGTVRVHANVCSTPKVPFAGFVLFIGLSTFTRNMNLSRFVRFNIQQARAARTCIGSCRPGLRILSISCMPHLHPPNLPI